MRYNKIDTNISEIQREQTLNPERLGKSVYYNDDDFLIYIYIYIYIYN